MAIAIPPDPERARAILNRGRKVARDLGCEWVAVRVVASRRSSQRGARELQEIVAAYGGRLVFVEADDVARALIDQTSRQRARALVIGRSRRPRFLRRLRRGTTERILHAKRSFDVVIANADEGVNR